MDNVSVSPQDAHARKYVNVVIIRQLKRLVSSGVEVYRILRDVRKAPRPAELAPVVVRKRREQRMPVRRPCPWMVIRPLGMDELWTDLRTRRLKRLRRNGRVAHEIARRNKPVILYHRRADHVSE